MKHSFPALFLLVAVLLFAVLTSAANIRVIPKPREVEERTGEFRLRAAPGIALPAGANADDRFAAELLRDEIRDAAKLKAVIGAPAAQAAIVLSRTGAPEQVGDEGYVLEVTPKRVTLKARTSAGLFYGVQTLRQLIEGDRIPALRVVDWPAMKLRGLHDDLSRGPVPTLEYIKRQLRTCAEYKMNAYSFYIEHVFDYQNNPLIGPADGGALNAAEVKELVVYARKYHITLVPEQQTFGHLHHVLKWEKYSDLGEVAHGAVLAPVNPKAYELVKQLYDELVPLFPGPYLHIGADETFELGTGQSKDLAAQQGVGQVYFDHIKRVAEILAPYKKQLMFWGDIALRYPQLLPQLPKGMIAMTWNYSARPNFDNQLKPFKDAGLDVVVCPGVNNWNRIFPNLDQALPNIRDFARDGLKYGALGMMNTTWDDDGEALFGLTWYPVVFGAAAAWQPSADVQEFANSFDWAFFRNPEGTPFADAIRQLNSVHTLLSKAGAGDANDSLFWLDPFIPAQRRTLDRLYPVARDIRLAAESAIETIDKNQARARRNADLLGYLRLAGYRLDYVGMKSLYIKQISDLYTEAYNASQQTQQGQPTQPGAQTRQGQPAPAPQPAAQNPQTPAAQPGQQNRQGQQARGASGQNIGRISGMNGLLQDFRDQSTLLRKMYEAAWLAENRPHWLGNVLALYDRETQMWLDKITDLATRRTVNGRMATPEEMGFAASAPATAPGGPQR